MAFKRFLFKIGIIIPFFAIFLMSQNTFAASLSTSSFDLHARWSVGYDYQWFHNLVYGSPTSTNSNSYVNIAGNGGAANLYQFNTPSVTAGGNYATIHFETNIVCSNTSPGCLVKFVNLNEQNLITCSASGATVLSKNLQSVTTDWDTIINNTVYYNTTLTFYGDVVMSGFNQNGAYSFTCLMGNNNYAFYWNAGSVVDKLYFEQNPATITWSNDKSAALLEAQNSILETQNRLLQEQLDREQNAVNNIEGQQSSDIPNSSDAQTTNLLGVINRFISALSNISLGSCIVPLNLPEYAGGSIQADLCQYKDKAPAIVQIGSSMLLICVFIPLAWLILRMIYSEIRSWTNG